MTGWTFRTTDDEPALRTTNRAGYPANRLRSTAARNCNGASMALRSGSLIATRPEIEARLVYPRSDDPALVLDDTEETLAELAGYLEAARILFVDGNAFSGPAAEKSWYDLSFALPAGAKDGYLRTKGRLVERSLAPLSILWETP